MLTRLLLLICVATTCTLTTAGQATEHRKGPDGLEGWLVRTTVETAEEQGPMPTELVISQNGKVLRRLCDGCSGSVQKKDGGPFFWNLLFFPDGKRVAYQSGSLHFNMECTLMDIRTGRHLAEYDCYHDALSEHRPEWATQLQNAPELN